MKSIIENEFTKHLKVAQSMPTITDQVEAAARVCINSLNSGGKILIFGNGGSAADAQHIAAELVGRFKAERKGLSAIALTTDSSALTCITNDYNYDYVFSRQVEALANNKDVVIGISTGGTSSNVVSGLKTAKELGCKTIGFSGRGGGEFNNVCNVNIIIPATETARIQEMHILVGHVICQLIDLEFC